MLRLASKRILGVSREVPSPTLQVLRQFSLEKVVDHCNSPRNVRANYDPMVGMGLVEAPACGDDMKIHIKDDERTRRIVDARSKTFSFGLGVASSSMATGWVKGNQMKGVSSIKTIEIARHLLFRPFKPHCSTLAEDAIKAGLKGYETKRALATATEAASGEKDAAAAASMAMAPVKNRLRPLSPHLSIYKPQSSSMSSIFNRISGVSLAAMVLGFYLLCLKMPLICFTYADFYQFFQFSSNFSLICAQIAAFALSYHLYDGSKRLVH
ncbi:iron-sulfur cluster assembly protein 1-like [Neltuma alba]|uniref:iron-sulfur cluster assembly protein 1-like n=1 Tax=Neltuma alba TaxID=207710 RepID=UPI0010A55AA5|nr:iron-sulfur cluster assembly protein 1-like [Prosopis alba]XP_028772631.1 iron-sulfur cluster assembly protein 1-like [Prosopis alba]